METETVADNDLSRQESLYPPTRKRPCNWYHRLYPKLKRQARYERSSSSCISNPKGEPRCDAGTPLPPLFTLFWGRRHLQHYFQPPGPIFQESNGEVSLRVLLPFPPFLDGGDGGGDATCPLPGLSTSKGSSPPLCVPTPASSDGYPPGLRHIASRAG